MILRYESISQFLRKEAGGVGIWRGGNCSMISVPICIEANVIRDLVDLSRGVKIDSQHPTTFDWLEDSTKDMS